MAGADQLGSPHGPDVTEQLEDVLLWWMCGCVAVELQHLGDGGLEILYDYLGALEGRHSHAARVQPGLR